MSRLIIGAKINGEILMQQSEPLAFIHCQYKPVFSPQNFSHDQRHFSFNSCIGVVRQHVLLHHLAQALEW